MNAAAWNQLPEVVSPAGRTAADVLAEGPRRQALPGFEPVSRDIVDCIVRCTHRIWEQKDVGLCRTHYADSCVMHTLNGPSSGVENVAQGTLSARSARSARSAFADRQDVAEDVIWSEDASGLFYSSHRITSRSTHEGVDAMFGAAASRVQMATTVADCVVRENLIVEEWGATAPDAVAEPAVAVARDDFMSQLRQRCQGEAADHPALQAEHWPRVVELGNAVLETPLPLTKPLAEPLAAASSSQTWVMRAFSSGDCVDALCRLRMQANTLPPQAHDRLALAVALALPAALPAARPAARPAAHPQDQNQSAPPQPRLALSDPLPEAAPVAL